MKSLTAFVFCLLLMLPSAGQELRVRNNSFDGRILIREGKLYAELNPLASALGVKITPAGEGCRVDPEDGSNAVPVASRLVSIGSQLLPLVDGEDGGIYVAAEAFVVALGGSAHQSAGSVNLVFSGRRTPAVAKSQETPADTKSGQLRQTVPANPDSYFITQYPSSKNPYGNYTNGNCGPTCLSMVAVAYDRVPPGLRAGDRQGLILWCREAMTGGSVDESKGTNYHQVERAATQLKLNARLLRKFSDIDKELDSGRLVIMLGNIQRMGFRSSGDGGHWMLLMGRQGDNYVLNDPGGFYKRAGTAVPKTKLLTFFKSAIAIGP